MILPNWATDFSVSVLLKFVTDDLLPSKMDADEALRTLWISDFFKVSELVEICIQQFIRPQINKTNVITFIEDAYSKLKLSENEEDVWYDLLDYCLDYGSNNEPLEILKTPKHDLPTSVIDEIIERFH